MIPLIIFYIHIIAFTAGFTSEYQKEDIGAGFLNVGFMVLIFSVGWSISTFVLKYVMREAGFGIWLNRDAVSLLLLTMGEIIFYYFYFRNDANAPSA
ncbi:MAG: hypothetical protein PHP42_10860 [Bacteroidota bacterium]|nr:hypothetical protein [Bacteroidota bacterium]